MAALSADMYTIINQKSGTCLAVSGVDGTTVIGEARNDEPNQKWKVELVGDGLFDMRNVLNGYFLSFVRGVAGITDGLPVTGSIGRVPFRIELDSGSSGGYSIIVPDTSQCIDLSDHGNPASGTPVTLWEKWGGTNQIWRFEKV